MTPEEHDLIFSLVVVPGRGAAGSKDDLLRYYDTTDGVGLGLRLLKEAIGEESKVDLEAALVVCRAFGIDSRHLRYLIDLIPAEWHERHEDVVSVLGELKSPEAVGVLHQAATWVPGYLDWDDNRALATKPGCTDQVRVGGCGSFGIDVCGLICR